MFQSKATALPGSAALPEVVAVTVEAAGLLASATPASTILPSMVCLVKGSVPSSAASP